MLKFTTVAFVFTFGVSSALTVPVSGVFSIADCNQNHRTIHGDFHLDQRKYHSDLGYFGEQIEPIALIYHPDGDFTIFTCLYSNDDGRGKLLGEAGEVSSIAGACLDTDRDCVGGNGKFIDAPIMVRNYYRNWTSVKDDSLVVSEAKQITINDYDVWSHETSSESVYACFSDECRISFDYDNGLISYDVNNFPHM